MEEKDFMDEFGTMTKIGRHPNIVTLMGACKHEGRPYIMHPSGPYVIEIFSQSWMETILTLSDQVSFTPIDYFRKSPSQSDLFCNNFYF